MGDRSGRGGTCNLAVLLTLVGTLIAGCGDDASRRGDEVLSFAEVQADDFVFEADPHDPTRGIFRVTTTEPMICAIVWGETEELGRLNNSLAMNGTGIVDHDVFLPGAEPGRTYYFRVQGSTADGRLYRSDIATFTIEAIEATSPATTVEGGRNLALSAVVLDASSEFSDNFAATNAIDDSGTTEWSSAGDGDDAFITLDLGGVHEIAAVEFVSRSMADGTTITETFTVTIDDDATFGPFPAGTPVAPGAAEVDTSGRIVRFDVDTSTGGNVGAVEVRVLAP